MTIQKSCDQIIVLSDLYDELFTENKTGSIKLSIDCCEPIELDLELVVENQLVLEPSVLNKEQFISGIYTFTITVTDIITNSETIEQNCTFLDCGISCEMFNKYRNDLEKLIEYNSLFYIDNCGQCDCEKACDLYTVLKNNLYKEDECKQCDK
jgi:hypothetical protein